MNAPERLAALQGLGESRLRKEDARFIQGKGHYVDDIQMPGMLHMDIVRSPFAHARIKSIDKSAALAIPGVIAVLTADDLKPFKLHWMPTLAGDVAAVLADEKVHFQMQEVAVVIAEDRYAAADGVEAVQVEYEELPVVIDPYEALKPDAPVLREDLAGKTSGAHGARDHHNHIFTWDAGDAAATDAAFAAAPVVVKQHLFYPRVHPCPLETCGCVASFDPIRGELTTYMTSQAPHVVRTVVSLLSGIPESKVRIVSPDIGGGFGNKVGVYPGYVCAIAASIVLGKPVKWVEDRIENISSTAFARDYHMDGEIAATADGRITGLRVHVLADHGAFDACADPTKFPAGMFHICSGSYDIPAAFCSVKGVYTNKAPGGVAYRCSFRVTEAVYLIERLVDVLAQKLGMDKAAIRAKNFIRKEQFPVHQRLRLRVRQRRLPGRARQGAHRGGLPPRCAPSRPSNAPTPNCPTLMGIGLVSFTEVVGAGPSKMCDILGVGMFDSCEIRVHPTGSAIARMGTITQGQGHQTTYAQIIATELGIPSEVIQVEEGDTSTAPYGLGTYGSRSTPGGGCGHRAGGPQDPRKGPQDRGAPAGGERKRPRLGDRPLQRQGRPGQTQDDEGHLLGRVQQRARRPGAGAGGGALLRPAQLHLPVRHLPVRGRHRPWHRRDQDPPLLRAGRLRHAHQPDDHRGPDPRWPDRRFLPSRWASRCRSTRRATCWATR